jgi:hypothetical protein
MDLLSSGGDDLKDFMINNELKNAVTRPTRIQTNYYKKRNEYKTSSTLLDVIIYNNEDLIAHTAVIDCPFSDHCFVATSLKISTVKQEIAYVMCRNLSEPVLDKIRAELETLDLSVSDEHDVDSNWIHFKLRLNRLIDKHAPIKRKLLKTGNQFPWIDKELIIIQNTRDLHYKSFKKSNTIADLEKYKEYRDMYTSSLRLKMKEYFASKTPKDFKNSKKFWAFYSSTIKVKSDKSCSSGIPDVVFNEDTEYKGDEQIGNMFNTFFTTIKSNSSKSMGDSKEFTSRLFSKLINDKKINLPKNNFEFSHCDAEIVTRLLSTIDSSSGAGVAGIATKVIKASSAKLAPTLAKLFILAIDACSIPSDWKSAVVTPIYKNKGVKNGLVKKIVNLRIFRVNIMHLHVCARKALSFFLIRQNTRILF